MHLVKLSKDVYFKVQRLSRKGVELNKFEMEENLKQSIKYIVYVTVNTINKKIYIGVHTVKTKEFDGYLGNGVYVNKPSSYKKSKTLFHRAVNKYGPSAFIRITLFEFDTMQEALDKEAEIVNEEFLKREDVYNTTIGGNKPPIKCTEIHQYDLNGNYITSYSSIKEAGEKLKIKVVSISESIKKHQACHNFLWSYERVDKIEPWSDKTAARKVGVYDLNGNLIKIYPTIIACKKDYCGCVHVLYGTRKTCKQCTFKFID